MARKNWTRDELIVAFNLYCRTPFGKIHNRNPEIIALAKAIKRTPSALSWKLANFSSFDPAVTGRNLRGATHGAILDREIWEEFNQDWNKLVFESQQLRASLLGEPLQQLLSDLPEGRTRAASVMVRVNQGFFRSAVLAAYDKKCCITGLSMTELLCASHIVPWSVDKANRTNPRNGLCLNSIHDRAFDRGLISFDQELRMVVSPQLRRTKDRAVQDLLLRYEGTQMRVPAQFHPDESFLDYHSKMVFRS